MRVFNVFYNAYGTTIHKILMQMLAQEKRRGDTSTNCFISVNKMASLDRGWHKTVSK